MSQHSTSSHSSDSDEIALHFFDYWRVISVRWQLVLLVFMLVVITTGVVSYLLPNEYAANVSMEVREEDSAITVFNNSGGSRFNPKFLTTQFQIIQQKEILYPVIKSLELDTKWNSGTYETAYKKLRKMIDVHEVRNTDLIQIQVFDDDPKQAALIANAIAEEYQRKRIEEQEHVVNRSLKQLDDEVAKQRLKVETLQKEMVRLRIENGIPDLNPDNSENPMQAESTVLMSVEEMVSSERLKNSQLRARSEQIAQMTDDQIMRSVNALDIKDATIEMTLPMYQQAVSEEARMLSSGLGINHPLVKSLRAKKDVMQQQLADEIIVLRRSVEGNLKISDESLKSLESRLAESRANQQSTKTRAASYFEAKNAYIQARKVLEGMELKLSTERVQRAMPRSPTTIWEKAEPAQFPVPRIARNMTLAVVVGLVFGVGLCFFIEYLDTSIKTMADIEKIFHVPILAVIPKDISLLINESDDNPDAEAYRIMRTNIEFNRKNHDQNTITVSSVGPGEGKTTTLCNLAYTFAKGGYSTLVVDADLRRPAMHRMFGMSNAVGLSDYLTAGTELDDLVQVTKVENLFFMASGKLPSDSVGVLNSSRMMEFIEEVKGRYDLVFFDSPPILVVSDASILASCLDFVIMVVQHRRFPRSMAQRGKQAILNVGGNILGVAFTNVDVRHDQYFDYNTSYYNYHAKNTRETVEKPGNQGRNMKQSPMRLKDSENTTPDDY